MSLGSELPSSVPVADTGTDRAVLANTPDSGPGADGRTVLRRIAEGDALITVLAIVLSLVVGAVLICIGNDQVAAAAQYFFARPADTFVAIWNAVSGAYLALFQGGVYNFGAPTFAQGISSLFNSLNYATPLIAAGLGIAVGFRSGVFNIGGQGQVLVAAAFAGYVGFAWDGPPVLHMLVALAFGLLGGTLWAGIVGVLKATTGAHEVIVTIMLNYVAFYALDYFLHTSVLRAPGSNNPQTPAEHGTAVFFPLLGERYALNFGFLLVIVATIFCAWLLSRSSLGFKMRAVGENPRAARVAGIEVNRVLIAAMAISGLLVGLAGVYQVLGQTTTGFGVDIDAGIGFNAITVTLLGRSKPWGVFWAGILFGVFQAGGYIMQAAQNVDVDIVQILQSLIVLFIAAPPLVRTIFRLPDPAKPRRARRPRGAKKQEVVA
jgi:simple sugar transport system permease protein